MTQSEFTFKNVLVSMYKDLTDYEIINENIILKYCVKAWNIGLFYKLIASWIKIAPSELILSKSVEYRFNPNINYDLTIHKLSLSGGQIIVSNLNELKSESEIVVIEFTNELVDAYLNANLN